MKTVRRRPRGRRDKSRNKPNGIAEYWQQQQPVFRQIYRNGLQSYTDTVPGIKRAFAYTLRTCYCIDEGTPGGVHGAGSFILLPMSVAVQLVRKLKLESITSHAGCGAAALAFADLPQQQKKRFGNPTEYAKWWSRTLAEQSGVTYAGHVSEQMMVRPSQLHTARIAYYDGVGNFDPTRAPGLPMGFTVSRRHLGRAYAESEIRLCIQIALGEHGFGNLFTKRTPFVLAAIGDAGTKRFNAEALEQELLPITGNYRDRVRVECFAAPQ